MDCNGKDRSAKATVMLPDRKEQSKKCARSRRSLETEIFSQLDQLLPKIETPTVYHPDRIGMLRLASALCRMRTLAEKFFPVNFNDGMWLGQNQITIETESPLSFDTLVSQENIEKCVDGFLIIVNKVGQMLFVTSSTAKSIGFTQLDLIGRYLREYIHEEDWCDLRDTLCKTDNENSLNCIFRMKTALAARGGRARKLTMAIYRSFTASIVKPSRIGDFASFENFNDGRNGFDDDIRLIHCIPFVLSSSNRTSPSTIVSRHEMDMRFLHCDESFGTLLGYKNSTHLTGTSFFQFVHPDDVRNFTDHIRQMHKKLHCRTGYYRCLHKSGSPVWVCTEMFLHSQNTRGGSQKMIICSHEILSKPDDALQNEENEYELPTIYENTCNFVYGDAEDLECDVQIVEEIHNNIPLLEPVLFQANPVENTIYRSSEISAADIGTRFDQTHDGLLNVEQLAPFISDDMHTLTPFNSDSGLTIFLEPYYEQWASSNNLQQTEEILLGNLYTDEPIPLIFKDFNFDDGQEIFVEETGGAFSQLNNQSTMTKMVSPSSDSLNTPPVSCEERTIDGNFPSRKRSHSMPSTKPKDFAIQVTRRHRLDEKTIESFELEMEKAINENCLKELFQY